MSDPTQTQIGGTHYTDMAIQPFEYTMANGFDPFQHTAIKYASRAYSKGDAIEQVEKLIHTAQLWRAHLAKVRGEVK